MMRSGGYFRCRDSVSNRAGFPALAVNRQKRPKIEMAFRHREPTRQLSLSLRIGLPASAINPKSVPMKNRSI
jgi:hypothetical protein